MRSSFKSLVLCQSSIDECHSCESRNPANNGTGFRIKCGMIIPQTMLDRALVMETTAAGGRATPDSQPIFVKYTRLEMVTYSGSSHFLFSKDFYPALLFKTCRPAVALLTLTGTGQTVASPWACYRVRRYITYQARIRPRISQYRENATLQFDSVLFSTFRAKNCQGFTFNA